MKYLENNICEFTPLFNIDYTIKKNIISCCFFKMVNSGYKNFKIYVDGLIKLYYFVEKSLKNYSLRVFIDNNINEDNSIMDSLKKLKNIELVIYSCPNYKIINNTNYHIGLFGSLIRLFPMFNFPNNDANIVIITDIDEISINSIYDTVELLEKQNKIKDLYLIKIGDISKSIYFKHNVLHNGCINPYSVAVSYAVIKKIEPTVILEFINNVKNVSGIYSYHYNIKKENSLENSADTKFKLHENFIYGVDEYFLNKVLSIYIIENKLPYAIKIYWNITGPLYYVILNDSELDNKKTKLLNIFINYVLDKSGINYDKKLSLNKKFDIIDKLTYINKKNNKINLDKARLINSIIYKLFIFLYTNNNYTFLFPKEFYKIFINKDLFGIYKLKTIMFYNINHKNIILEKDKFNNDEYNKLYIFAKKYTHNLLV
jgi:hypothetical protein